PLGQARARRRRDRLGRGLDRRAVRRRSRRARQPASGLVSGPLIGTGPASPGTPEFGRTWWGRAWLVALEQRARLDPGRLPRGRENARSGAVGDLTFAPGEARARVRGRKTEPYQVRIRVRPFADDEWDRVLEAIAARLGHAAALLDGELPPEIADDAAAAGLDLLPGGGEVGPRCDCPDDADPCKHSAAACYLIADALDADPFALFLLRGRTRDQVLAGIRARRRGATLGAAAGAASDASPAEDTGRPAGDAGVDARAAFRTPVPWVPIPAVPLPPARPGSPAALPVDPPPWRPGLRGARVELPADAASRAWELASGLSADAGLTLDPDADLVRRAARTLGTPTFATLAARSGAPPRDLARQALARRPRIRRLPSCCRPRGPRCAPRPARRRLSWATGSPQGACSCGSAGTCAGTPTHDRTRNGNPAARPKPIRPWPWPISDAVPAQWIRVVPAQNRQMSSDRSFYGAHGKPVLPTMSIRLH